MFVAGPNYDAGRAPQVLASLIEGQLQTSASRRSHMRHPKRQQDIAPHRAPAYEHIRNGTSSKANPQRQSIVASLRGADRAGRGGSWMDEKTTNAAGIDWAKEEHALCVIEHSG